MMKHEFEQIAGYEVSFEDYNNIIEPMYMATNLNKVDFVKCIDRKRFEVIPQKSAEQIALEEDIKSQIAELKENIKYHTERIDTLKTFICIGTNEAWIKDWKDEVKRHKDIVKECKIRIKGLKWVLE